MAFPGTPAPADPSTTEPWTFSEESAPVPLATITLVEGSSFVICDAGGDIAGRGVEGLFVADTRICSRLLVTVDDRRVDALTVAKRTPFAASFVGRTVDRAFLVFRDIWVGLGMRQDIRLRNLTHETRSVTLRAIVASDLAELFAVKAGRIQPGTVSRLASEAELRFVCDNGRRGLVSAAVAPRSPQLTARSRGELTSAQVRNRRSASRSPPSEAARTSFPAIAAASLTRRGLPRGLALIRPAL